MPTSIGKVINHFNYVIVFDDSSLCKDNAEIYGNFYKGEFDNVLNIVWYVMHLPRSTFDIRKISELTWVVNHYNAHNIHFIPKHSINLFVDDHQIINTAIIFCEDSCYNEALYLYNLKNSFDICSYSNLSDATLKRHWDIICDKYSDWPGTENKISYNITQVNFDNYQAIPLLFNEHYLYASREFFDEYEKKFNTFAKISLEQICLRSNIAANIEHSKNNLINVEELFKKNVASIRVPISLIQPSLSPYLAKNNPKSALHDHGEGNILKTIAAHSALASGGLVVEIPKCPDEAFRLLNEIELDCKNQTQNPKKIWASLKKIGNIIYDTFSKDQIDIIRRASSMVAFTDFPIGLAIIPPNTAPLSCYCDITYRHLTPLAFAALQEFSGYRTIRLTDKCKILMLECLPTGDVIRAMSDNILTSTLHDISHEYEKIDFLHKEIKTIDDFTHSINNAEDIDILIISAHGYYDQRRNFTAINIGSELLYNINSIIKSPPVVFFSACHVTPRGHGSSSISDLFMQKSAVAVLGTYIPVDVCKNAKLMCRLIINIAETQVGRNRYKNLLELWSDIMASNAVHEICDSNKKINDWFYHQSKNGINNSISFQTEKCVGKLRRQYVYTDSIEILRDMMQTDDILNSFNVNVADDKYFPESLFYELSGFPENIILKDIKI